MANRRSFVAHPELIFITAREKREPRKPLGGEQTGAALRAGRLRVYDRQCAKTRQTSAAVGFQGSRVFALAVHSANRSYNKVIIYKYCDRWGVDILRRLQLKVTPPNEFNDPFEFSPKSVGKLSLKAAKEQVTDHETMMLMFTQLGIPQTEFPLYESILKANIDMVAAHHALNTSTVIQKLCLGHLDFVSREFGVVCFVQHWDVPLMWSHYADSHRGLVIGFDAGHSFFAQSNLRQVDYSSKRVSFDVSWTPGSPDVSKAIGDLMVRKSRCWKYEQEWRMLLCLKGLEQRLLPNGKPGHFLTIPREVIVELILGCRCSGQLEKEVRAVMETGRLNLTLDRVQLDEGRFALAREPC